MRPCVTLCLAVLACGTVVDDVRNIAQLHDEGPFIDADYAAAKQRALASAFPPRSPSQPNSNASAGTIMIDCVSDGSNGDVKVLTVVVPQPSTPIDIRRSCPDVVGFSGDTVHLRPVHVPP